MVYRFGGFELDTARVELRAGGTPLALEPQVFAILAALVESRERVVSVDELIRVVWQGRPVADSTVASRVRSLRQALGDDGRRQRYVRTIRGRGFRFVAPVAAGGAAVVGPEDRVPVPESRPSLAVMAFRTPAGGADPAALLAFALPHEIVAELSRLRWLRISAPASAFRFRSGSATPSAVCRKLGVRYVLCGTVEIRSGRVALQVELVEGASDTVIWADGLAGRLGDVRQLQVDLTTRVLTALDLRIPLHEASLARLSAPEDLDAWSAYHLGLQSLYAFTRAGGAAAGALFARAAQLDPNFARAHAGLSFVHFQAAFLRHADDVRAATVEARRHAERAVQLDPLDPFVNFVMGRTFWLEGDLGTSLAWLARTTELSPNFAQGIYASGWAETLSGRSAEGRRLVDIAMQLSPLDPLYYAMLGTRALAHLGAGEDSHASEWAERAARMPGAHALIAMIAAAAHALYGEAGRAAEWAANVRLREPALDRTDFFRAFPIQPGEVRERIDGALSRVGF